jgi:hypothetical protein
MSIPTTNPKRLKDDNIKMHDKLQITAYLEKEAIIKLDNLIPLTDARSRNEVLEHAIDFYFGCQTSSLSQDYLCSTIGTKMEGLISNLGTRLSRIQFKNAVELDILTRMLGTVIEINGSQYNKLRKKSVDSVKQSNGNISILEACQEPLPDDD